MIEQFDFAKNWRKVKPLLRKQKVELALTFGMTFLGEGYEPGKPPWIYGNMARQSPKKGTLGWYQPVGRCHYIAPFCLAIGRELYPNLKWGVVSGYAHSVSIGYEETSKQPKVVMDILLFDCKTAEESIAFASVGKTEIFDSLCSYLLSFSKSMSQSFRPTLCDMSLCHCMKEMVVA